MKKGLLSAAAAMILVLAFTLTAYADTAVVTTSDGGSVNLRSEASTDSTVLDYVEDGTEVEVLGTDGEWSQVSVNGYTGYIMSTYLTASSTSDSSSDDDTADSDTTAEDAVAGEATVTVGEITYSIAATLPDGVLPADYTAVNVDYDGTGYGAAKNSTLDLTLLYLISDSYSGLFIYDSSAGTFTPYLTVGSDEHYVTILETPSDFTVPDGYDSATISTDATGLLTAYQLSDPGDLDDTNLYIVYGISNSGTESWYTIDTTENTYVRIATPGDVTSTDEDASSDAEDSASEKLSQYKKLLMILVLALVILLIIIINLLLFYRRGYMYEDDEYEEDDDEYYDDNDENEQQYAPVKPQDTQEVDVPDISRLVDDTTAEALEETSVSAQEKTEPVIPETPAASQTPAAEDADDELEFFDLDDL